jgi:hypothetical protein
MNAWVLPIDGTHFQMELGYPHNSRCLSPFATTLFECAGRVRYSELKTPSRELRITRTRLPTFTEATFLVEMSLFIMLLLMPKTSAASCIDRAGL